MEITTLHSLGMAFLNPPTHISQIFNEHKVYISANTENKILFALPKPL